MPEQGPWADFQSGPWNDFKSAANPNQAIIDAQAAKYPGPVADPLMPDANTPMNILSGLGRAALNLGTLPYQTLHAVTHPVQDIITPMNNEADKARAELNQVHPDTVAAFGHLLASIIPGIGPWAAGLGERAAKGDTAGALAEAGAMLAAPHLAKAAIPEADTLMKAGADVRSLGNIPNVIPGAKQINAAINIGARPIAATLESAARVKGALESPGTSPAVLAGPNPEPLNIETTPIRNKSVVARDVQQRLQSVAGEPREPITESAPLNIRYPEPSPIPQPLENGQTLTAPDVNRWLGVSSKEVLRGADPGKQILDQGLLGPTKAATQANIQSALGDAGQALEAQLKAATAKGTTLDAQTPIADAYAKLTEKYGVTRSISDQAQVGVIDKIESRYPELNKLSPSDAHKLKVELGNSINWGDSQDPVNKMMIQIYGDLNDAIKTEVPEAAGTQRRWNNLFIASKASRRAIAKDVVGTGTGDVPVVKVR